MRLRGIPKLADVDNMLYMLSRLGVRSAWQADGVLELEVVDESEVEAPYHLDAHDAPLVLPARPAVGPARPLRSSTTPAAASSATGRSIACLGDAAAAWNRADPARQQRPPGGEVRGGTIFLGGSFGSTVLGTAGIVAWPRPWPRSRTVLEVCAAQEPEVVDLCRFLNRCGARIEGLGSHRLVIDGVERS
ncbi:MAG: hypothetical protein R3F30_04230 [Planctomycetota bacterium]